MQELHHRIAEYDFQTTQFSQLFSIELSNDGTVNQDNGSVELLSSAFTQTSSVGHAGVLDYLKLVGCSHRAIELYDHHSTAVSVELSGCQFFHQGTPIPTAFIDKVSDLNNDYRLASGGFFLYYPDIDIVHGVLVTNELLYAVYGILGLRGVAAADPSSKIRKIFASSPYDTPHIWTGVESMEERLRYAHTVPYNPDERCSPHQGSFMVVKPILRRDIDHPLDDYHRITLEVNPGKSVLRWLLDGELCHSHHGIGRRPCDLSYCTVSRVGSRCRVCPRRAYLMTGTFTMLDQMLGDRSLVALCGCTIYQHPRKSGAPLCESSFAITGDVPSMRIFGQGACVSLRRICIERYYDPRCWDSKINPCPMKIDDRFTRETHDVDPHRIELPDWRTMVTHHPDEKNTSRAEYSPPLPMPLLVDRSYIEELDEGSMDSGSFACVKHNGRYTHVIDHQRPSHNISGKHKKDKKRLGPSEDRDMVSINQDDRLPLIDRSYVE